MPNSLARLAGLALFAAVSAAAPAAPEIRIGMIGLDTSHVTSIAALLNDPAAKDHVAGARVVCAYKAGSPDVELSRTRIEGFTRDLHDKYGVEIVGSIGAVLARSDAIMIMSVDGRAHLAQAREVFPSEKPVFMDKPLAGNLADAAAIVRLAQETRTPLLSASAFRFSPLLHAALAASAGDFIRGVVSYGNGLSMPQMPPLFFEGIHSVEAAYTVLGPGCEQVTCVHTPESEVATGIWPGGRTAAIYAVRDGRAPHGVIVYARKQVRFVSFDQEGFAPLAQTIVDFFRTRQSPVPLEQTLEIIAFLQAADQSQRHHGAPVNVQALLAAAQR